MSAAPEDGGPAFPTDNEHQNGPSTWHYEGLTLRDYFAAKVLASLITTTASWSDLEVKPINHKSGKQICAQAAYEYADAMLEARSHP